MIKTAAIAGAGTTTVVEIVTTIRIVNIIGTTVIVEIVATAVEAFKFFKEKFIIVIKKEIMTMAARISKNGSITNFNKK